MTPANCKTSARYCSFEVVLDHPEVQIEYCKNCKREVRYNKYQGRIDNKKYLEDHVRDFCQPIGPTEDVYLFVYGEEGYKKRAKMIAEYEAKNDKKAAIERGTEEARDALRIWKKLEGKGMTDKEIVRELRKSS